MIQSSAKHNCHATLAGLPDTTLPESATARSRFWWLDREAVLTVLIIKFLVLWVGVQGVQILGNMPVQGWQGWLEIWTRWDALNYVNIAQNGYAATGENRPLLAFMPLHPMLIRLFAWPVGDYHLGAFLLATVSSLAVALLLFHLARIEYSIAVARRAVWFLFIFPTSYFLHIGYTESTFLAFTLGCFLAARTRHWMWAGLLAALAGATRINGAVLLPVLLLEAGLQWRETRTWNRRWLWIGMAPLGLLSYMAVNQYVTGDPLAFLTFHREHWGKSLTWPWVGLRSVWSGLNRPTPFEANMIGYQECFYSALGLAGTLVACWKLRLSYSMWMLGTWLMGICNTFVLCMPRYTLLLFPLMFLFARAAQRWTWVDKILTAWSLLFLAIFAVNFARGCWSF